MTFVALTVIKWKQWQIQQLCIIKNKTEKTHTMVDVIIGAERDTMQKQAEKKLKNTSLYRDNMNVEHAMHGHTSNNWHQRNSNKQFKKKNWKSVTEKHSIASLQKTAILYTTIPHIMWKVLQPKT